MWEQRSSVFSDLGRIKSNRLLNSFAISLFRLERISTDLPQKYEISKQGQRGAKLAKLADKQCENERSVDIDQLCARNENRYLS